MNCKNCGAPNAEGATFCANCGASLMAAPEEQQPAQPAYAPPPQPQQPPPPQAYPPQGYQQPTGYGYPPQAPPKKKKTGLIIGIAVGAVVLIVALVLILGGGGGKSGIAGRWTVVDTEGWSDYEEGLIFNFKSNGTLTFEAPKDTPEELKGLYEMMNLLSTKYKVSGDKITLTVEFFGEKDETEMRFSLEGDTLTLFDEDGDATVLKRTK